MDHKLNIILMFQQLKKGDQDFSSQQTVKRYFNKHVFDKLKNIVLDHLHHKQSPFYEFVKYLKLDDSLFESLVQILTFTKEIDKFNERKKETYIYYILNGFVDVYDFKTETLLGQISKGSVIVIDGVVDKRRIY